MLFRPLILCITDYTLTHACTCTFRVWYLVNHREYCQSIYLDVPENLVTSNRSNCPNLGSTNQFFDVDFEFDVDTLRITCIFVNTMQTNGERSCTVMFGPGQDLSSCRNLSQSLKSEQRANVSRMSVNLPIFLTKLTSNNVCLVVRASDNRHTVEAERMLTVISGIY